MKQQPYSDHADKAASNVTTILIIGGYGTFGFKIAERLSDIPELQIIIAGRNAAKAQTACKHLAGNKTQFKALKLDRLAPLGPQITTAPDLIIDASGPFQEYSGDTRFAVIQYAIAHACHYIDLSDDAGFSADIHQFDNAAKAAGVFLRAGVSTYPVITAAAVKAICDTLGEDFMPETLIAGIAPSPRTDMGRNVINAIASYAGKAVNIVDNGQLSKGFGLTETMRRAIAPPGYIPMQSRLFALVDSPEALELPRHYPSLKTIQCYAGPRPTWLSRMMITLARLVKWRALPSLSWLSPIMHRAQSIITSGPHRGGMFTAVSGQMKNGTIAHASWHLIAEGDDGPHIPALPAVVLIRQWLAGHPPEIGASTAIDDITMADLDREFSTLNITHGIRHHSTIDRAQSLYRHILDTAFDDLPKPLQDLHSVTTQRRFQGHAKITRGTNIFAGLVASIFRFPKAAKACPVTVVLTPTDKGELWERYFDGRRMVSLQYPAKGRQAPLLSERFGPFVVNMAVVITGERLYLKTQNWRFLGLPLPKFLLPSGDIFEHDADGRFNFHVDICAPILGRLVKYEGWLEPIE